MIKIFFIIFLLNLYSLAFAKVDSAIPSFDPSFLRSRFGLFLPDVDKEDDPKQDEEAYWLEMVEIIKMAIQDSPEDRSHYFFLSWAYEFLGDFENQLEALRKEYQYTPEEERSSELHGNLARACLITGLYEEAREWLIKADSKDPDNRLNRFNSARTYILTEDYDSAARELKRVDELTEDKNADFYYSILNFCWEMNIDQEKILAFLKKAVEINPENYDAHRTLGIAYRYHEQRGLERYEKALAHMMKAYEINPDVHLTSITIANTYIFYGLETEEKAYLDQGVEWANKTLAINPSNGSILLSIANVYLLLDDEEKALDMLEKAASFELEQEKYFEMKAIILNNMAYKIYQSGEHLEKGLMLADQGLLLRPECAYLLGTKGELLYKMERYQEARGYILRAIAIMPEQEELHQDLKNIEEALGKAQYDR